MSLSKHFMVYDTMENYYDIYLFDEEVNVEELKELIIDFKKKNIGVWTLEMIEQEVRKKYKVNKVIFIDDIIGNSLEINEVGV